ELILKFRKCHLKYKKRKKNPPKTKKKNETEVEEREETREEKNKPQKPMPKDDEIEIIPIIYEVPDIDHPFHHLNKKPASVDISKICEELDKEEATKFIKENNPDYKPNLEKTLKEISTQLFQLNQKVNQPANQNNSDQIGVKSAQPETLISPRLKRRAATPELIESEVELSTYTLKKILLTSFVES
ncbi:hypothetical protein BpHYR1_007416, partial [Brachionus plicatilis]